MLIEFCRQVSLWERQWFLYLIHVKNSLLSAVLVFGGIFVIVALLLNRLADEEVAKARAYAKYKSSASANLKRRNSIQ